MQPVPFDVSSENHTDGVRIVKIKGELDLNTAPQLDLELQRILGGGGSVVVNLSDCDFIDSTGVALIVNAWQQVDRNGGSGNGRLVLCCPKNQVRRLLDITGLESSIDVHEDIDGALAAVDGG